MTNPYRTSAGKPERKEPLGRILIQLNQNSTDSCEYRSTKGEKFLIS
jgi:hypothetical protein